MKLLYTFFTFLLGFGCISAQDYFIKEDFTNNKFKFRYPFEPDWNKDFFIETEVKVAILPNADEENAGIIFAFDSISKSYYGLYIKNSSSNEKKYKDYFKFRAKNIPDSTNSDFWQETSIVNHEGYNRLQIYKIDNEAFFSINDQVVYHIQAIQSKGNKLQLASGKKGIYCNYIHAYYLGKSETIGLKETLQNQLIQYQSTGIHHKIANSYPKVLDLTQPESIPKFTNTISKYDPVLETITIGSSDVSFASNVVNYDSKTGKALSAEAFKTRLQKLDIYNENLSRVQINSINETIENMRFMGKLPGDLILLKDTKYGFYKYDLSTKKMSKFIKEKSYLENIIISHDYKYLCFYDKVYSLTTGDEIAYTYTGGMSVDKKIGACYQDKIIVKKGFYFKEINLVTKEEIDFKENGRFQDHYFLQINGRELSILDMSTNQFIAKNIQLLTFDREINHNYKFQFFPESHEVYVSDASSIKPCFYFSNSDNIVNTSSFIVNLNTNEITPFLLYKSTAQLKQDNEALAAVQAQSKIEVEQFMSQFRTFGNYYELNYDNFDYVNVSNNAFLNNRGIGGTTYVIGKFCTYNGGSLLALGVTKDQYTVELLTITHGNNGAIVKRKKLGLTQIVNGNATQIASVKVYRNSTDPTKFTLVVNDGKETKMSFISKCN